MAIRSLNRALAKAPNDTFANLVLAAALALTGEESEARETLRRYVEATERQPPSISAFSEAVGWMGPGVARMVDGLRAAGVPEERRPVQQ